MPDHVPEPMPRPVTLAGPTCERSSLPPWLRLAITFAVLFGLKRALPGLGVR